MYVYVFHLFIKKNCKHREKLKIIIQGTPVVHHLSLIIWRLLLKQFIKCYLHRSFGLVVPFPVFHFLGGDSFFYFPRGCLLFGKVCLRGNSGVLGGPQRCSYFGRGENSWGCLSPQNLGGLTPLSCAYSTAVKRSDASRSLGPLFLESLEANLYPQRSDTSLIRI